MGNFNLQSTDWWKFSEKKFRISVKNEHQVFKKTFWISYFGVSPKPDHFSKTSIEHNFELLLLDHDSDHFSANIRMYAGVINCNMLKLRFFYILFLVVNMVQHLVNDQDFG